MDHFFDAAVQNDSFAKKLRDLRLSRSPRLSQERAARHLGITRATLANYESGRVSAPLWFLCYDTNSEFWPQFDRNMELLKREMKDLAKGKPL